LPFLFDCTLDQYLHRIESAKGIQPIYLQLDIKQLCATKMQMTDFARTLVRQIKPFKDIVCFIISANDGFNRPETMAVCVKEFEYNRIPIKLWDDWHKNYQITTEDLWKQ
jgi:hypothetical protein